MSCLRIQVSQQGVDCTQTLLIKRQSLSLVLLTARPWHSTCPCLSQLGTLCRTQNTMSKDLHGLMMIVENIHWNISVWNVIFDEKQIKPISRFWVYRSESILCILFLTDAFFFLVTNRSQTSTGLSVHGYGGLHKVLTMPATVLLAKTNPVMFL